MGKGASGRIVFENVEGSKKDLKPKHYTMANRIIFYKLKSSMSQT